MINFGFVCLVVVSCIYLPLLLMGRAARPVGQMGLAKAVRRDSPKFS